MNQIRYFEEKDLLAAHRIHEASGLPDNCFPNLYIKNEKGETVRNPLYIVGAVYENERNVPSMMSFVKITGELFLLLDHDAGTPEELWQWLQDFKEWMAREAWNHGLEQISAWLPPEIELSFAKRMEAMGFVRSPYVCWTLNLS